MQILSVHFIIIASVNSIVTTLASQAVTFTMRKVAFSTNQFGIDVYKAMNVTDKNVALCPFCISSSLTMLLLGAEGNTFLTLREALYLRGLHPHEIHHAFHDLIYHLALNLQPQETDLDSYSQRQEEKEQEGNIIHIINNIYIQRHFPIQYPYQFYLHRFYNTTVHPMDFVLNAVESTRHINTLFEQETNGKIKNVLHHPPSSSTNLLLLNALYFSGTLDMNMSLVDYVRSSKIWNQDDIEDQERANQVPVMLEARKARVRYGVHQYLNCTAVEVPFKGGLLSLVTLIPADPNGMALLETRLSAQRLNDILNTMEVKRVNILMPRIRMEHRNGNLSRALFNLGLIDLFTPGYASLFGISDFGWLHVTNITHDAYVEVKEPKLKGQHSTPTINEEVVHASLDRPFLYFIMDNIAGLVIAMGKMVHPVDLVYVQQ